MKTECPSNDVSTGYHNTSINTIHFLNKTLSLWKLVLQLKLQLQQKKGSFCINILRTSEKESQAEVKS